MKFNNFLLVRNFNKTFKINLAEQPFSKIYLSLINRKKGILNTTLFGDVLTMKDASIPQCGKDLFLRILFSF